MFEELLEAERALVWTIALRMVTASSIMPETRALSSKIPHGTWQWDRACGVGATGSRGLSLSECHPRGGDGSAARGEA